MKVVHVVKDNVGAQFAYDEVEFLVRSGVDVAVAMPASKPGHMAERYRSLGVRVADVDPQPHPRDPRATIEAARRLRATLSHERPDIVHIHHVAPCVFVRGVTGRKPPFRRVFEVHGPLHLESPHTRALDLWTRGPNDYYIATSRATERIYRRHGIGTGRIAMTYSGFHTGKYVQPRTGALREQLGVAAETPLVGMVAWMYPPKRYLGQRHGLKGHDIFIQAIPHVLREVPDARFVIIGGELGGGNRFEASLKTLAREAGVDRALTFFGPRSDVHLLQPDLDVAVHPSRSENPGGAVYTLLAGVPTAGSAVGGIPEVVVDGETGLLFPPDDPAAAADAVLRLLADRDTAVKMAAAGRTLVESLFSIERTAADVLRFYEQLMEHDAGSRR